MSQYRFSKEIYSKVALIKAAYNFTDAAYIHLDTDDSYFYVTIESKYSDRAVSEKEFVNEMLTQSVRHEVYQQTKNIRELLLARAMATSVIVDDALIDEQDTGDSFEENDILKDWFATNEKVEG
jgi:His-Xaa-Ser system protein HxsD